MKAKCPQDLLMIRLSVNVLVNDATKKAIGDIFNLANVH